MSQLIWKSESDMELLFKCVLLAITFFLPVLVVAESLPQKVTIEPELLSDTLTYPHSMSIRIHPPWTQRGFWTLRSPETLGSSAGLLFIDHSRPDFVPVTIPKNALRWKQEGDGALSYVCSLENGASFRVRAKADGDTVSLVSAFRNRHSADLSDLGTQFCLIQRGVEGFEDPAAHRTFIRYLHKWIRLSDTHPGIANGQKPFFIVTNTRDLKPMKKASIERSWFADEQADLPLIATVSEDGRRIIALAFDNSYKIMTNAEIPCIHADPMYPDCRKGNETSFRGKVYFIEGTLHTVLSRFYRDFPEWQGPLKTPPPAKDASSPESGAH